MTKKEQRRLASSARRALTEGERTDYSSAICEAILTLPELRQAQWVFSYQAMGEEADLSVLHGKLESLGKRLAFPVCGRDGQMEFYVPGGWKRGPYGIREPDPEHSEHIPPERAQILLIPLLAFDEQGRRLGHGAGYYDRYLPKCPRALRVAAAFEAQKLPRICTDEHDLSMDRIVTERKVYII